MLTPPLGVLQAYQLMGSEMLIPVPKGNWYVFATEAQAQQVFALAQKSCPTATLKLVSGTLNGNTAYMLLPSPNPLGLDVWIIEGTIPVQAADGSMTTTELTVADYAGDVWDRGPLDQNFGGSPDALDTNGAYGGIGGENLTLSDDGSGIAIFRWSAKSQQPVV